MDKRFVIAIALVFLILLTWPMLFGSKNRARQKDIDARTQQAKKEESKEKTEDITTELEILAQVSEETLIPIRTPLYEIQLTTDGARATSWKFKDYFQRGKGPKLLFGIDDLSFQSDLDNRSIPEGLRQQFKYNDIPLSRNVAVVIKKDGKEWNLVNDQIYAVHIIKKEDGKLNVYEPRYIDLIPQNSVPHASRKWLAMQFHDPEIQDEMEDVQWTPSKEMVNLQDVEGAQDSVEFSYITSTGLGISKKMTFSRDSYVVDIDIAFRNQSSERMTLGGYKLLWGAGFEKDDMIADMELAKEGPMALVRTEKGMKLKRHWDKTGFACFGGKHVRVPVPGKEILFSMGLELQRDLENGNVSERLRQRFTDNNIPLPQNVTIQAKSGQDSWVLYDDVAGSILCVIEKEDDSLYIYKKATPISWVAFAGKYFVAALIPGNEAWWSDAATIGKRYEVVTTLANTTLAPALPPKDVWNQWGKYTSIALVQPEFSVAPGEIVSHTFRVYVGPKKWDLLRNVTGRGDAAEPLGLGKMINFGMFSPLGKATLWLLKMFYRLTNNYGVSLILLTVLIKIVYFPLTQKSFKSMNKMKGLQPKIAALKEKHRDDPQRLQKETMKLYKQHKVNPMGGCLPMVFQLPVFWALFATLRGAVELRGATFIPGWVTDLSLPDTIARIGGFPINILPLLMTGTMLLQQLLQGNPSQGQNNKMMAFMPLIFAFIFYGMPSGLVLYWLCNNILAIGHQYLLKRQEETETEELPEKKGKKQLQES